MSLLVDGMVGEATCSTIDNFIELCFLSCFTMCWCSIKNDCRILYYWYEMDTHKDYGNLGDIFIFVIINYAGDFD